jgi:nitrate reductase assembly molybdenum cofactor insertion protein NarJ
MYNPFQKYQLIAGLFDYPDPKNQALISDIHDLLIAEYPGTMEDFNRFTDVISRMDLHAWEEFFVGTFEVEALIPMDVGYILFGEDYKRGNFLAMMQQEQINAGNDPGSELADHLPNMLRLLPRMADTKMAEEMGCSILVPAVKEILKKFEHSDNTYRYAFKTLLNLLESDFSGLPYDVYQVKPELQGGAMGQYSCGADFLQEIGKQKF